MRFRFAILAALFLTGGTALASTDLENCLQAGRESERLSRVVLDLVKSCNQKPNAKTRHELCEQLKLSLAAEKHEVSACHHDEAGDADVPADTEKGVRWAQTWIDHMSENPSFCR